MSGLSFGSEPGERITADDIELFLPGLKVKSFLPPLDPNECRNPPPKILRCGRGFPSGSKLDADGNIYFSLSGQGDEPSEIWRTRRDGQIELVARIFAARNGPFGTQDQARFAGAYIDMVHGLLYVRLTTECFPPTNCEYSTAHEIVQISGLPRLRGKGLPRGRGRAAPN